MSENHDAVVHDADAGSESRCPVAHGRAPHPTQGGGNRGWWPNQLNLKILAKNPAVANPLGGEFDYAEAFKTLDLGGGEAGHRGGADHLAGLVAGRLRPLRPVHDPDGVAQRRHLPHQRRPRRRRRRAAALRAAQQLAGQREPRQGPPPAVAGQEEVRPEPLVGRPDDPRRQRRAGVDGLQDLRLRRWPRRTSGSPTRTSTGVPRPPGSATSATPATASSRTRSPRSRWASSTSTRRARTATRTRSPRPATSARRSAAWR